MHLRSLLLALLLVALASATPNLGVFPGADVSEDTLTAQAGTGLVVTDLVRGEGSVPSLGGPTLDPMLWLQLALRRDRFVFTAAGAQIGDGSFRSAGVGLHLHPRVLVSLGVLDRAPGERQLPRLIVPSLGFAAAGPWRWGLALSTRLQVALYPRGLPTPQSVLASLALSELLTIGWERSRGSIRLGLMDTGALLRLQGRLHGPGGASWIGVAGRYTPRLLGHGQMSHAGLTVQLGWTGVVR